MTKQLIKSLMMLTLVVGLALAANVVSANGQYKSQLITADIPFEFVVADKTFPSGTYTVTKATQDGKGLNISSVDGKSSVSRLSNSVVGTSETRKGKLVFHRYGQQHFLAEVWASDTYGRQLIKSSKERQLEHEQSLIASKSDSGKGSYEVVEVVALFR